MALDLVKNRKDVKKMEKTNRSLSAINSYLQNIKNQDKIINITKNITNALTQINSNVNLYDMKKLLDQFRLQSEGLETKFEFIDECTIYFIFRLLMISDGRFF